MIRLSEANTAQSTLDKVKADHDGKLEVLDCVVEAKVLEGKLISLCILHQVSPLYVKQSTVICFIIGHQNSIHVVWWTCISLLSLKFCFIQ